MSVRDNNDANHLFVAGIQHPLLAARLRGPIAPRRSRLMLNVDRLPFTVTVLVLRRLPRGSGRRQVLTTEITEHTEKILLLSVISEFSVVNLPRQAIHA
jgi:hypothetical protein